jgi:hypothetical protein
MMFGVHVSNREWVGGKTLAAVLVLCAGCSLFGSDKHYDDDDDSGGKSSGGSKSSGGTQSSGGNSGESSGGTVSTGGDGSSNGGTTGGSHSSGGTKSAGGTTGGSVSAGGTTGGSISAGGDFSASGGDFSASGGDTSTGGDASSAGGTGGKGVTGGSSGGTGGKGGGSSGGTGGSTGGSSGSAGSSGECGSAYETHALGYITSPGTSGCWHGFAYTVTDDLGSSALPTDFSACDGSGCSICSSGTVVADIGYAGWAGLGADVNQVDTADAPVGTVVPSGTGLQISYTNAGGSPLRIQIQDETTDTQWCYTLGGSGGTVTVPWTSFNTTCWDTSLGEYYLPGQAITGVQLVVPGSAEYSTPYSICLDGFSDG